MLIKPEKLNDVDEDLANAVKTLTEKVKYNILVVCGRRTEAEQLKLYEAKASKVYGPNAPHVRGIAVDLVPVLDTGVCLWDDTSKYAEMRIILGGLIELEPKITWDSDHFQKKIYPH